MNSIGRSFRVFAGQNGLEPDTHDGIRDENVKLDETAATTDQLEFASMPAGHLCIKTQRFASELLEPTPKLLFHLLEIHAKGR